MDNKYRTIYVVSFLAGLAIAIVLIVTLPAPKNGNQEKEIASRSPATLDGYTYLQQLNKMAQEASTLVTNTASIFEQPIENQDLKQSLAHIQKAKLSFLAFAQETESMKPPQEIKKYHKKIISSFKKYHKGFELSEKALEEKNDAKLAKGQDDINKGATEFFDATQLIVKAIK